MHSIDDLGVSPHDQRTFNVKPKPTLIQQNEKFLVDLFLLSVITCRRKEVGTERSLSDPGHRPLTRWIG
jgi:hypothetical protein